MAWGDAGDAGALIASDQPRRQGPHCEGLFSKEIDRSLHPTQYRVNRSIFLGKDLVTPLRQ